MRTSRWFLMVIVVGGLVCSMVFQSNAQLIQQGTKLLGSGAVGPPNRGCSVALTQHGTGAAMGDYEDSHCLSEKTKGQEP
jgi:hypothetical protein